MRNNQVYKGHKNDDQKLKRGFLQEHIMCDSALISNKMRSSGNFNCPHMGPKTRCSGASASRDGLAHVRLYVHFTP